MQGFNIPANETPEQRAMRFQQQQAPMTMPTNVGTGMRAVADAIMARNAQQQAAFPAMPGGGQISPLQGLQNAFGLGGGMY